jgi:hypothetical protein
MYVVRSPETSVWPCHQQLAALWDGSCAVKTSSSSQHALHCGSTMRLLLSALGRLDDAATMITASKPSCTVGDPFINQNSQSADHDTMLLDFQKFKVSTPQSDLQANHSSKDSGLGLPGPAQCITCRYTRLPHGLRQPLPVAIMAMHESCTPNKCIVHTAGIPRCKACKCCPMCTCIVQKAATSIVAGTCCSALKLH